MFNSYSNPIKPFGHVPVPPILSRYRGSAGTTPLAWLLSLAALAGGGCASQPALPKPKQEYVLKDVKWPVAFSPDSKRLFTASDLATVKAWDAQTGRELAEFSGPEIVFPVRETGGVGRTQLYLTGGGRDPFISPRGTLAVSVAYDPLTPFAKWDAQLRKDGLLLLWDTVTGKIEHSVNIGLMPGPLAFSPDGKFVAVVDGDWGGKLIDLQLMEKGQGRPCNGDESVKLVDVQTGKVRPGGLRFPPRIGKIQALAFSPDGKRLACAITGMSGPGGRDFSVAVWDMATSECVWKCQIEKEPRAIVYSPDGSLLAVAGLGDNIHLWDARDGQHHYTLASSTGLIEKLTFHPNGHYLASDGHHGPAHIWDLRTKKVIHTFAPELRSVMDLAFSPDGKWLATCYGYRTDGNGKPDEKPFVTVWNLQPTKGTK